MSGNVRFNKELHKTTRWGSGGSVQLCPEVGLVGTPSGSKWHFCRSGWGGGRMVIFNSICKGVAVRERALVPPFRQSGRFATVLGRGIQDVLLGTPKGSTMRGMVSPGVGSERVKYYWPPLKLPGRETAGCQPWVCILFFQSRGGSAVPPPLPLPPLSPNCSP